nr:integrase, catalytic region, zinc finger, CCHC-type, peptidase aspartic, catalytic [Tanacetum cinerariifolium]
MLLEGFELTKEDRESQLYDDFEHFHQNKGEIIHDYYVRFTKLINDMRNIKMTMPKMQLNSKFVNNMLPKWGRFVTAVKLNKGLKESNYDQLYAYLKQYENRGQVNNARGSGAIGNEGAQNGVGNADECDAFDFDVDEAPTAQTMFMSNRSFADPVYDEVGPSYDLNILSEYVKDKAEPVVENNADTKVVEASLTAKLAIYREQVELYERRAKFQLTEREQKIKEQLRIVITDRNIKEEILKKEFHSVKMQLNSTINHNKSMDVLKIKAKALKEQTKALKLIKALMVYPLNTPVKLVLRVLPTKSQVKINIFALKQLFLEFEKTCKKRITPTGLTEAERDFEQTNECYHTKVISFFKILKEHFEGIQKALTKEIKEMKEIFEELEAGVAQHAVNKKSDEIEQKSLLIVNDNLVVDCLSKEVFYIETNSELTVSRFTIMHDAHTVVQARCLELEADLSKLNFKIQHDDHNELVNCFSNLEGKDNAIKKSENSNLSIKGNP